LWKVNAAAGVFTLSYLGVFREADAHGFVTGAFLTSEANTGRFATASSPASQWQLQAGSGNTVTLVNNSDTRYLGYSWSVGQDVYIGGNRQHIFGNMQLALMANTTCASGQNCDIKWYYKIYSTTPASKQIGTANLLGGNYLINTVQMCRSLTTSP